MISNMLMDLERKSQRLFDEWKYLLLQEKCRLCKRMIHPLIDRMDFDSYRPPARYFIGHKEIISDVICQFCLPDLSSFQAVLKRHQVIRYREGIDEFAEFFVGSAAVFMEPIQSLIYRLKYSEDVLLAKDLACLMHKAWQLLREEITEFDNTDSLCLVSVPLHKKRLHERGFNQAEAIAEHLSRLLSIKIERKVISRIKNTKSQQTLTKLERASNVAGVFRAVASNVFKDKTVILIDDVCTSGATLVNCAQATFAGGAQSVHALTVSFVP